MATQIRSWLRVGPQDEAARERDAGHFVLNVLEMTPITPYDAWMPILVEEDGDVRADVAALDRVAELVRQQRDGGRTVYLHCGQGMERSPLSIAWVLWKLGEAKSFDEAYAQVRRLHPLTQDRAVWVPWDARYGAPSH